MQVLKTEQLILFLIRKHFYKFGYVIYKFNWFNIYLFLNKLNLNYKFTFNLMLKQIQFKILHNENLLKSKMHILRLFLKLNQQIKITEINLNKLINVLEKIEQKSLKYLVSQNY